MAPDQICRPHARLGRIDRFRTLWLAKVLQTLEAKKNSPRTKWYCVNTIAGSIIHVYIQSSNSTLIWCSDYFDTLCGIFRTHIQFLEFENFFDYWEEDFLTCLKITFFSSDGEIHKCKKGHIDFGMDLLLILWISTQISATLNIFLICNYLM